MDITYRWRNKQSDMERESDKKGPSRFGPVLLLLFPLLPTPLAQLAYVLACVGTFTIMGVLPAWRVLHSLVFTIALVGLVNCSPEIPEESTVGEVARSNNSELVIQIVATELWMLRHDHFPSGESGGIGRNVPNFRARVRALLEKIKDCPDMACIQLFFNTGKHGEHPLPEYQTAGGRGIPSHPPPD